MTTIFIVSLRNNVVLLTNIGYIFSFYSPTHELLQESEAHKGRGHWWCAIQIYTFDIHIVPSTT